ncbi:preprotein translocase subunit SecY [Actinotignum sanguinis]|uniref:Protein translocase subunit SecY n=2 Tax=Actinomycetaceae TaxID=2049 RepID=A0ABZ0RAP5_9ACTO|nr:preprotein translocase subunit SecY [Actinotignum sanguinis]WPJ88228.1 preprotein translocase subunit SecY [Schaalia turicensis]MDE1552708.1 preprotein translocase subunit SecY [Actinotignum sanguinis]MDE1565441.1 preprotein translocase subunit SecY [Actinotignum sanguinis]MDE1576435.1 preprotein translocase subunit SecY [Actinotignum sanguinis]MDE1642154.1 preprotein translocase subunit SecY [Actinotignum sanguinis]
MIKAFAAAFRTPDLRRKLLFTMMIMVIYRLGSFIPAPFVSLSNIRECTTQQSGAQDLIDMLNLFSGGAMMQLSVFALGIMPYITASIIVQLLRVVIPRFQELHKQGQSGTAKLTEYTRYLTIGLGLLQSSVVVATANFTLFAGCKEPVIPNATWWTYTMTILAMTAGTGLIMWMAELITERGVGNGMSILIFTGICAGFPSMMGQIYAGHGVGTLLIVIAVFALITLVVTFVEQSQRRIPVQYAKRVIGRRTYGGSTTYLPIKINMANVIPVIFASSILMLPTMISTFGNQNSSWVVWIQRNFQHNGWAYILTYALLTFAFTFFYTSIAFDTDEVADNMKKYGGFIPNVRAGKPTADYLHFVSNRLTWVGATYLTIVALIPLLLFSALGIVQSGFGGTSIMILVGVGLQTVKDINAQLQQRHYEGFLGGIR